MTIGLYDDGDTAVPGGITGRVERVIVVGAGIAGLTVANALGHSGIECSVLEARDRIGGRLNTVDLDDTAVDLGGSWIHHPVGNPMSAFAERVGIRRRSGDPLATLSAFDLGEGRRLTSSEVADELTTLYETFPAAADAMRRDLGSGDRSVEAAIEEFLAGDSVPPAATRRVRQGLRSVIEGEAADSSGRQSLRWLGHEIEYEGEFFGDLPDGGYRSLVNAMAADVDVRLEVDVTAVERSADGVRVKCADGSVVDASHVVVTVPLGVLKLGFPRFSPALPAERVAAIERLGFGRFEKIALRFDQPFWRDAGVSHLMLFPPDPEESTVWVMDLDAFGAGPVLVFLVFDSTADHVVGTDPDDAVRWARSLIAAALGGACPEPTAAAVTSWCRDPYTAGAYTHVPPGAAPADADLLGEPIDGRLLFAGEHTQSARLGYADGAMRSGIREAKRLLAQPSVRLGPKPKAPA